MAQKILVTYASRTGTTAGVASSIGRILADEQTLVDVLPVNEVTDCSSYRAIVVGSAIQAQKWLPEAMLFLRNNQTLLKDKPVAIFSVCMTLAMPHAERYRAGIAEWLEPVRKLIHPMQEGYFAGSLDFKKIPRRADRIKFRISVAFGIWKPGDHRNWTEIEAWAADLKNKLC